MTVLYEAQDRIAYALEGARFAAEDAFDAIRDRALLVAAIAGAVVAAAVIALSAGGGDGGTEAAAEEGASVARAAADATAAGTHPIVSKGFSLSLPAGWERSKPPEGASFAASSGDGLATTTLWAEKAPGLGWDKFVAQSMENLDEIGTHVRISDEVGGATNAARITELRAEVPLDGGVDAAYHVILRASGPYRYYLATSLQPGASPQLVADAELLGTSFRPQYLGKPGE
jgi:hypothetical protein